MRQVHSDSRRPMQAGDAPSASSPLRQLLLMLTKWQPGLAGALCPRSPVVGQVAWIRQLGGASQRRALQLRSAQIVIHLQNEGTPGVSSKANMIDHKALWGKGPIAPSFAFLPYSLHAAQ